MKAIQLTLVSLNSPEWMRELEGRLLIFMDSHRIIVPNENSKRIYLSKKRWRELKQSLTRSRDCFYEYTPEYHYHCPKNWKDYVEAHKEPPITPKIKFPDPQPVIIEKKISWWKKLFN